VKRSPSRDVGGEPLAPEDLAILRSESAAVAGHTLKIAILDPQEGAPRPDAEALRARVAERIEAIPRMRRKLRPGAGRRQPAAWVDDPDFDVRAHVRALPVAAPVTDAELRSIVAGAMEERLDRSRPLWTIDVLDQLEDGGVALIWKIHHSMADGATAMRFSEQLLWDAPAAAGAGGRTGTPEGGAPTHLGELREALRARQPGRLPGTLRRELHRTRHPSPFDGDIGTTRVVAFASVPLPELKRAAKTLVPAASVNDAVLALVAGGLRSWAEARDSGLATVRVKVPVSLHHLARTEAANRDSLFVLAMPLDEPDPVERLRRINAETGLRKRAGDPLVLDTLLRDLGRVAPPLRRLVERLTLHPRAFALNVSNVVGPATRTSVLGAPVRALYSLAEIRERHGLRVAVVSMADELHFGLCADPAIVGDLDPFVIGILTEASVLTDRSRSASGSVATGT
jgi:WS/DGAT/MGAT family acyltransferase